MFNKIMKFQIQPKHSTYQTIDVHLILEHEGSCHLRNRIISETYIFISSKIIHLIPFKNRTSPPLHSGAMSHSVVQDSFSNSSIRSKAEITWSKCPLQSSRRSHSCLIYYDLPKAQVQVQSANTVHLAMSGALLGAEWAESS